MAAENATEKKDPVPRKTASRKAPRKKAAAGRGATSKTGSGRSGSELVGIEIPKSLTAFGRQLRRDLTAIEKQIEIAGKDTRRSLARIVRDASHQLGALEARGEREWRTRSRAAQRDIERIVKRVRKATLGPQRRPPAARGRK
jgi:hypothetical protein